MPLGLSCSQQISPVGTSVSDYLRNLGVDAAPGGHIAQCILSFLYARIGLGLTMREFHVSVDLEITTVQVVREEIYDDIDWTYIHLQQEAAGNQKDLQPHPRGQHGASEVAIATLNTTTFVANTEAADLGTCIICLEQLSSGGVTLIGV